MSCLDVVVIVVYTSGRVVVAPWDRRTTESQIAMLGDDIRNLYSLLVVILSSNCLDLVILLPPGRPAALR